MCSEVSLEAEGCGHGKQKGRLMRPSASVRA
jgi:hypothetical protein